MGLVKSGWVKVGWVRLNQATLFYVRLAWFGLGLVSFV
jgi:hypothetical protein